MLVLGASSRAQIAPPHIKASKLTKPPKIDGKVDPEEWKEATHVLRFVDPYTGNPTSDATEGWVGYDGDAIYVAFICHDSQPGGLIGREIQPGSEMQDEDTVTFRINPFGTRGYEGRSRFRVNLLNTQSEEISGGRAAKREWRGDWKSATQRLPDGWSVEMSIPWKMLNYPKGKALNMDLNLERFQARTRIGSKWANTTVADRPEYAGFWEGVEAPTKDDRKKIQFLAYTAPEYDHGRSTLRSGLDVRYSLTPTLTSLVSLNPDFRNIENQIAGVDFTRTERFLDEARPFFNEGSDFFDLTGEFTFGRMFYSQRIPTFDYGAKAYGRITPTLSAGVLTTVDTGHTTASVARIAKTFGPKADASIFATRFDQVGRTNNAYGATAFARRGTFSADFQGATEADERGPTDSAYSYAANYEVPKWFSTFKFEHVDKNFDPPLAYVPWQDRHGWYQYTDYSTEYRTGPIRGFNANVYTAHYHTNAGALQQEGMEWFAGATTRKDIRISASRVDTQFADGRDSVTGLGLNFNQSNRFKRFGGYFETGERGSKPSTFFSLHGSVRVLKRLDLGAEFSALRFDGTDQLAIVTIGSELSPTRSITGRFVQRNGKQNAYLAFRNGGLNGTELYFILGDPNSDTFQRRVSVKVVWAF
ncbi:DUF5916 domain-containing protein [Fimbriimonas ginsengisoli]|uniref:DUF5916 domain-containing protein n=1 Tax=Fimbriimonas ginsengisoli Gsoil 348 TaxID=661478 RepID=A0A068NM05_FIMGI|nr:DUF5916 domain-containing protein [Fimbriimonas ginsengisoli]AIE84452.1 hypothetical protein OP10G_1084 [Fimbriimonas ginsengisoli Gsoil 348]